MTGMDNAGVHPCRRLSPLHHDEEDLRLTFVLTFL